MRFAVERQAKSVNGVMFEELRIVLKDDYGCIGYTDFDRYINRSKRRIKGNSNKTEFQAAKYVVQFLNYVLKDLNKPLSEVTIGDLQAFLDWYCEGHGTGRYPGLEAVENCRDAVTAFVSNLSEKGKMKHIRKSDLYSTNQIFSKKAGKIVTRSVPKLDCRSFATVTLPKFTDLPGQSVFDLIEMASQYEPMLTLGICSEAWGGIRTGGIVNMRRPDASDPGIIVERGDGTIKAITIDIRRESLLTKNGKHTGSVKRPRIQQILPEYRKEYEKVLKRHITLLEKVKNHNPNALFLNTQGNAMSDESYRQRFAALVKNHFVPYMLNNKNDAYQIAARKILERGMSPHALRHWFSAYLALHTDNPAVIAYWRGDKSNDSANLYLMNKGILESQLQTVASTAQEQLLMEGVMYES